MTNKEVVTGFFLEGYVRHNYVFRMEHMAAQIFPDMQVEILDLIEEHERIAVRARFTGTHSAALCGIPATEKKVCFEVLEPFRMEKSWSPGVIGRICRFGKCWIKHDIQKACLSNADRHASYFASTTTWEGARSSAFSL